MRWLDVFGAPGVGKSALCNDLWPTSVTWDEFPPPAAWRPFLDMAEQLAELIRPGNRADHWRQMLDKAVKKMSTVHRRPSSDVYVQTGLAMRGIDLGWRIDDPARIAAYFEAMPVSLGCVLLTADVETIQARNAARGVNHPSRALGHLAPRLERPIAVAREVLVARGGPLFVLDTREPIDDNRRALQDLAHRSAQPLHARAP
jgi:hypothetical protein